MALSPYRRALEEGLTDEGQSVSTDTDDPPKSSNPDFPVAHPHTRVIDDEKNLPTPQKKLKVGRKAARGLGRPDTLHQTDWVPVFLDALRGGATVKEAAHTAGVDGSTHSTVGSVSATFSHTLSHFGTPSRHPQVLVL